MPEDTRTNQKRLAEYIENARKFPRIRSFFWLLRCADALNKYSGIEIGKKGDSHSRTRISALEILVKHPEGISQQAIARQTGRTKQAIAVALDNLEKKGQVIRMSTDNDRRTNSIRITKEGIDYISKVFPNTVTMCNEALASLSDAEVEQLLSLVTKLTRSTWQKIDGQSPESEKPAEGSAQDQAERA
jgi:DNA-binding MarR family transcriptional regulator